jgi:hypothetical protein
VLLSPIFAGFLSTTTRKKLLIGFHLLLLTTMGLAEVATTRSADCCSQNPTASKKCSVEKRDFDVSRSRGSALGAG